MLADRVQALPWLTPRVEAASADDGRTNRSSARNPALDGIRALAFVGVLLDHLRVPYVGEGDIGVNVFFVLSGFLITSILLAEHSRTRAIGLAGFYLRRAARLLPALTAVVLTFTVYDLVIARDVSAHRMVVTAVLITFYLGNWARALHGPAALPWLGHTWSLAIEEQFYLLWPLCMILVLRRGGARRLFAVAVAGSVLSLGLRLALWHGTGSVDRIYNGTDANADQLLIGCALAAALVAWPEWTRRLCRLAWFPAVAVLLFLASHGSNTMWRMTFGYSIVAVCAAALVGIAWCAPRSILSRLLAVRPLAGTGRISYGLYLWHFPILLAVEGHVSSLMLRAVVVTVTTFAVALASWRFLEQPAQRYVRRRRHRVQLVLAVAEGA